MKTENAIKIINKTRKENKNKWYFMQLTVNGMDISLKGYNTWIQKLIIGNMENSSGMDIKVSEFNEFLKSNLK